VRGNVNYVTRAGSVQRDPAHPSEGRQWRAAISRSRARIVAIATGCSSAWFAAAGLIVLADKGYIGAGQPVLTPYRGRNKPASPKAANSAHAKLRAPAERANAQLKTWCILR
jgi:DDE superfamily endonuclease